MPRRTTRTLRGDDSFDHPIAGRCDRDRAKVAVFWNPESEEKDRRALLAAQKLVPVEAPEAGESGHHTSSVNQTALLFWAERKDRRAITKPVLQALEASDAVLWIAGVYKAERAPKESCEGFFCVNPTRLYLSANAANRLGDLKEHGVEAQVDVQKSERLRGLVALRIENVSLPGGRGAIQVARDRLVPLLREQGEALGLRDISFESIPLISPTCSTTECCGPSADLSCAPATSAFVPNDPLFAQQWGMWRISVRVSRPRETALCAGF